MKPTDSRNLLFLFSLAPVALGCPAADDADTDANGDSSTGADDGGTAMTTMAMTTAMTTMSADSTGDPGTTGDAGTTGEPATTGDSGTSGSDGGTTSDDTGSTGATDSTGGTDGMVTEACQAYADWIGECYMLSEPEIDYTASQCSIYAGLYAEEYGMECANALEDLLVCLSMVDCKVPKGACEKEDAALLEICGFDATGSDGVGGSSDAGSSGDEPPPPPPGG